MGGKVLVPTREAVDKLVAARLAADVLDVPTVIIARTDADAANLITSDIDERDRVVHLWQSYTRRILSRKEWNRPGHQPEHSRMRLMQI